jgi:flagellar motor switch protein FliM
VGHVLNTGISRQSNITVRVGAQQRFEATIGRMGQNLAIRLLDRISPAPDAVSRPASSQ